MCWAACDRLARIAARLGLAERAALLARARRDDPRGDLRARLERATQSFVATFDGESAGRQPAAARRARLPAGGRSALRRHGRRRRARTASAATSCSATSRRTISASRRTPSSCAPSGTSTRWRRSAAARRRARCSRRMLACRNRHGLLAEHIDPAHGRAVGQFPADLQHGRPDQLRHPPVDPVGSGFLTYRPRSLRPSADPARPVSHWTVDMPSGRIRA